MHTSSFFMENNLFKKLKQTPLPERQAWAQSLLDEFSAYTEYKNGAKNPYLRWLDERIDKLRSHQQQLEQAHDRDHRYHGACAEYGISSKHVVDFMNFWYPVSRHQPQILLRCAAALSDREEQRWIVLGNYLEEIGFNKEEYDAHYTLLEQLMKKMWGGLHIPKQAEAMVSRYHRKIDKKATSHARATGMLAAIEHPALDISGYFHKMIELAGRTHLLKKDPYLLIHVDVEPSHIILSHESAKSHMKKGHEQEVIEAFHETMGFWVEFWPKAFKTVGYQENSLEQCIT